MAGKRTAKRPGSAAVSDRKALAVANPTEIGAKRGGGEERARKKMDASMEEEQQQQEAEMKRSEPPPPSEHDSDKALRIRVSSWSSVPTSSADDGVDESPGGNGSESSSPDQGGAKTKAKAVGSTTPSRGAKRRRADDTPMFLDKTYEMLERCPAELAAWTPRGESFVVKQPDAFAERVIPTYFKHNKFSSFVRQLNFYGFRKVRGHDATPTGKDGSKSDDNAVDAAEDTRGWWEFRHDKFVRGQREQLRSIKRRSTPPSDSLSIPSPSVASASTTTSTSVSTNASSTTIERAEFEEMRAEMRTLRDQVQQLNKHVVAVMQALAAGRQPQEAERVARPPPSGVPTTPSYNHAGQLPGTPGGIAAKQQFSAPPTQPPLSIYAPPAPSLTISTSVSGLPPQMPSTQESLFPSPRHDVKAMRSPVGTYHLRPLQSLIHASANSGGPGTPVGIPPLPSPRPSPMTLVSPRLAFLSHAASAFPPVSTPDSSSAQRHTEWEAYARQQRYTRPLPSPSATSPDVAVRQLSQMAAQTRSDLLSCIVARIIGFLRVQQQRQQQQQQYQSTTPRSSGNASDSGSSSQEVEGVADAVNSDIAQKLAWAQEGANGASPMSATSPAGAGSDVLLDAETAAMYRVEILKFISRELPRALNDAVEKRLAPVQKKTLNRSLLALLVQKAQAALEHQMRAAPSSGAASS